MTDQERAFQRDDQGVVLQAMLSKVKLMIESAEGETPDDRLANWLGFAIAAADLGPERSRAACDAALASQGRIAELLRRAGATKIN